MSLKIYDFENIPKFENPIFLLGSFESFHLGHNSLYSKACELNKDETRDIVLVFFSDIENMAKNNCNIFSDSKNRIQEFANLGIFFAIQLFYKKISHLSAEDFIDKLIYNQSNYSIIVGTDFHFGFLGKGDVNFLNNYMPNHIYALEPLKLENGEKVSTRFLKECIIFGEISLLNTINMYDYSFYAKLNTGEEILKLQFNKNLTRLRSGTYAVNLEINKYMYYALLLVNDKKEYIIHFIDFKVNKNQALNLRVIVRKEIGFFMKNEQQKISQTDLDKAKKFFLDMYKSVA